MLELLLCSLLTIFPDYLYRRYAQGKRLGKEITLYSVWFELRWGIIACLMLTVGLITVIFYNHPVDDATPPLFFRTVPILPETNGRVAEVYVGLTGEVKQGRADLPARQLEAGGGRGDRPAQDRRDRCGAGGRADRCPGGRGQDPGGQERLSAGRGRTGDQAGDLPAQPGRRRRPGHREARGRRARAPGHDRCRHGRQADRPRRSISTLLPAEKASAEAALAQAEVDLAKTVVRAGVSGRVEQFTLRVGDIVNPFMRPAGVLIPEGAGRGRLQAGFGQIEAQVMKVGMVAEATCASKPWTVIPMVVTERAGLHRRRPVPRRRATDRRAAGGAAGHHPGLSRAALRGRARRRDARQQLHRQRLYQQPRSDRRPAMSAPSKASFFTRWMRSGSCMP